MADQIADTDAASVIEAAKPADSKPADNKPADSRPADDKPGEAATSWTEERVEQLRRLWLEGLSASRIATELAGGITRNAVIGKVHRLGLSGRVKAPVAAAARPKPTRLAEAVRPVAPGIAAPMRGNVALAVQHQPATMPLRRSASEDRVVSMIEAVTIMELRESMCRWPVGDPSSTEFRYCGGRAPIGEGPYCKLHSRMAYQPVQDRRQRKSA